MRPDGYVARAARPDDLKDVGALVERAQIHDIGRLEFTIQDVESDWRLMTFVPERDALVVERDGTIVAYTQVIERRRLWFDAWGEVDPGHRRRGLGSHLIAWQEDRVRPALGTVALHGIADATAEDARALYTTRGFSPVRRFWTMERVLDAEHSAEPPPGIEIRSATLEDATTVHRILQASFREHYGFRERSFEEFAEYFCEGPRSDPSQWLIAFDGDRAVGALVCTLFDDEGWIDSLGVLPDARGKGIAACLLRRSFAQTAARGLPAAALAVDTENVTGAVRLYESVGMRARIAYEHYEKTIGAQRAR